ncbi:low-density lipoprotein receptor-related protein 1B-like [Tachysurus ichikawai]
MYWTDWEEGETNDSRGRIEKAWMDGSHRQVFVFSDVLWPNGLTLERSTETVYWCDAYHRRIEKIQFNGTLRTVSWFYFCPCLFSSLLVRCHDILTLWCDDKISPVKMKH